jgi:hypothetical protein
VSILTNTHEITEGIQENQTMKKLFSLSLMVFALAATMSAMNSPAPTSEKGITVPVVTTNDAAAAHPGNPNPPYDD